MAADDKKGGASTGAGSGGGTSSRKTPLSGSTRKPVTIDLAAKDVSKTDKPAEKPAVTSKPDVNKTGPSQAGSVPPTGKPQSQTPPKIEKTEATTTKTTASAKAAAGAAKASDTDNKPTETPTSGAAKSAAQPAASASAASKPTEKNEPPKEKVQDASSGGKGTPPPPPPTGGKGTPPPPPPTGGKGEGPSGKPPHPPKQSSGFGAMLAAGVVGALIVGGAGFGLHQVGMLQMVGAGAGQNATEVQALLESSKSRYSQLQQEIANLKDHATGSFAAKETIQQLTAQLDTLQKETSANFKNATSVVSDNVQQQVAALGAEIKELNEFIANGAAGDGAAVASFKKTQDQLTKQITALMTTSQGEAQKALKGVQDSLTNLQKQFTGLKETPAQLKDLSSQLAITGSKVEEALAQIGKLTAEQKVVEGKIEALSQKSAQTTKLIIERVNKLEKSVGTASAQERAARAIAIASLRNAVDSGENYEAELAAVEAVLPGDTAELIPLKAAAATGIPSSAALIAGFGKVAREMSAVVIADEQGGVVDRLFSSAKSLVSIRTPNESQGTSTSDVLGTMEARVSSGDLVGAMKAFDALPEPMKTVGASWAGQVQARLAADELVKKITAQVLKSLVSENK